MASQGNDSSRILDPGVILQGRYQIARVLGTGAFGRVYLAVDIQDPAHTQVAIKELLDTQFATAEDKREAISWFKREVSTLLTLEHKSIPDIHGYWTASIASGPFYLAMDYIPGQTLEEVLQAEGGRVHWKRVAEWGVALCSVLTYLHDRTPAFIFRDMKLPNVMLDNRTHRPILIDFGIARQLATSNATAIGTWGYVPYEQILGKAEPRSDLYALGATLHALMTGLRPDTEYTRLQRTGLDLEGTLRALFPRADTLVTDIPVGLAEVIKQATAFDIADRFPDAEAMAAALQEMMTPTSTSVHPLHKAENVSAPSSQPGSTPGHTIPPTPPSMTFPAATNPIVVSRRGSGQYTSIAAAVRHAQPGARIEVRPGRYKEALTIDKQVEIVGVGRVEEIVVETADSSCIIMQTNTATVRGLTLKGWAGLKGEEYYAVDIPQGQLVLEDCHITSDSLACVAIYGPTANPTIRHCKIHDGKGGGILFRQDAEGTIEDCNIVANDSFGVAITDNARPVIQSCRIHKGLKHGLIAIEYCEGLVHGCIIADNNGMGVGISTGANPTIQNCSIRNSSNCGVVVNDNGRGTLRNCGITSNTPCEVGITTGGNPTVVDCNLLGGPERGLLVQGQSEGTVERCSITGHSIAEVVIAEGSNLMLRHCKVWEGEGHGIVFIEKSRGVVEDCDIGRHALTGVVIKDGSDPVLRRCVIHGGRDGGIEIHEASGGTVEECDIFGNTNVEITVGANATPLIRRSKIHDGKGIGIAVLEQARGTIEDCAIFDNARSGLEIQGGSPSVHSCRINHNGGVGVVVTDKGAGVVEDCDLTDNGLGAWRIPLFCRTRRKSNRA